MEQDTASPRFASPARPAAAMSLVDCLFAMPEKASERRASKAQKADAARIEARLAAEMRTLIAERLRAGKAG